MMQSSLLSFFIRQGFYALHVLLLGSIVLEFVFPGMITSVWSFYWLVVLIFCVFPFLFFPSFFSRFEFVQCGAIGLLFLVFSYILFQRFFLFISPLFWLGLICSFILILFIPFSSHDYE